mmetsp:Transcript_4553/g.16315  ORF Transcript_4553/g.16315 Transcript_4553/m.16315 type:complete len:399 (-) Transcript_4553:746-1942(-)
MNFLKKSVSKGWNVISGAPGGDSTSQSASGDFAEAKPPTDALVDEMSAMQTADAASASQGSVSAIDPAFVAADTARPQHAALTRQHTPYPFREINAQQAGPGVRIDSNDVVHHHPHFGAEEKVEYEDHIPLPPTGRPLHRVPTPFPTEVMGDLSAEDLDPQAAEEDGDEAFDVVTRMPNSLDAHKHPVHRVPTPYPFQEIPSATAAHHEPSPGTQAHTVHENTYYNKHVDQYLHPAHARQAADTRAVAKKGNLGGLQTTDAQRCSGGAWLGPKPKPQVPEDIHLEDVELADIPQEFNVLVEGLVQRFNADAAPASGGSILGKKRLVESNSKRLGGLFTMLANGKVSEGVQSKLIALGEAMHDDDQAAIEACIRDMTTNDWEECSFWLTTVRRLTKEVQ